MSSAKLPEENTFRDLSDFGRPLARIIAKALSNSFATPITVTIAFIIAGIIAIYCVLQHFYIGAFVFLMIKSVLDAADGELARIKNTPSYSGRYLDSISDFFINLFLLLAVWYISEASLLLTAIAFFCLELQGTMYNYYYVILRNKYKGDTTSRVFENEVPTALPGESQNAVNTLFNLYRSCYAPFDRLVYLIDKKAVDAENFPKWFMTAVSIYGLGFQLLLIGIMLVSNQVELIIPFLVFYSLFIPIFIFIRRALN